MAGLPLGGGKGVVLADPIATRQSAKHSSSHSARRSNCSAARYVTAEDVGMSEDRMKVIADPHSSRFRLACAGRRRGR